MELGFWELGAAWRACCASCGDAPLFLAVGGHPALICSCRDKGNMAAAPHLPEPVLRHIFSIESQPGEPILGIKDRVRVGWGLHHYCTSLLCGGLFRRPAKVPPLPPPCRCAARLSAPLGGPTWTRTTLSGRSGAASSWR